jgi:lysozyme
MAHITTIDAVGVDLICKYEGFRAKPYSCPAGVPTIGYGTTRYPNGVRVRLSDKEISEATAKEFLRRNMAQYEQGVDALTLDSITQNQFNALVSFAYNVGVQALRNSTLLKKVNANPNDVKIGGEFMKWNKGGGKVLAGLTRRRAEEAKLYFS